MVTQQVTGFKTSFLIQNLGLGPLYKNHITKITAFRGSQFPKCIIQQSQSWSQHLYAQCIVQAETNAASPNYFTMNVDLLLLKCVHD